uniref:CCHC-type domain-containing protein n=1 Tax=Tanacetum cinerariifolium TaxID=118510 RepID=A0A6L2JA84_TANCI|nr:hypothetical protein [Tanacetum cinerariifolium]
MTRFGSLCCYVNIDHHTPFVTNIKFEEDLKEKPEEEFEEELEAKVEEDAPPVATPPIGSPITPPPLYESSSDTEAVAPIVASGDIEMPPFCSTFEGDDIEAYNNRFPELALMCPDLVPNEKKKIERYIRGFPERIKGNITSLSPTTLHDAINMARELVEQVVQGRATRVSESNKRKWKDHQKNTNNNHNHNNNNQHQQQNRRLLGPMLQPHLREIDCRVRLPGAGDNPLQNVTCYGCGEKGHLKNKCPKRANQRSEGARARAYVMGTENPQQNPNVVTVTLLVTDHYTCILFDSGAEKSFVPTEFTPFIDVAPAALDTSYDVELADGKVVSVNTILRGCTLALFNQLSNHHDVIVCYEKIVRIPLPNGEILEIQGERPEKDPKLLSCIKAEEKKPEDIRIVRDFPEVFPDDLSGLLLVLEIELRIDLILQPCIIIILNK